MRQKGIGVIGAIIAMVIAGLIVYGIIYYGPDILREIRSTGGGGGGGPPNVDFGELSKTYTSGYISQYLWNNYANKEIRIPNAAPYETGGGNSFLKSVDIGQYYFCATASSGWAFPTQGGVYLTDPENLIESALQTYVIPTFNIFGIVTMQEFDFGPWNWRNALNGISSDIENVIVIQVVRIEVIPR
jgi:hypothetical protein